MGNVENNQNHIGLQAAYGITDHFDMRMRYEYLWVADEGGNVNVIGFGPKLEAIENWLSFYVPLGFAFGGDLEDRDAMDTWEIHPTVLFSVPLGKYFEVNTSTKYIHEFQKDGWRFIAFDLGMGISTDLSKYAIRPEIGWAWSMNGEDDVYSQFSVGVTLYPGAFKKKE